MTGEIEHRNIYDESVANLLLTGLLFMIPCLKHWSEVVHVAAGSSLH